MYSYLLGALLGFLPSCVIGTECVIGTISVRLWTGTFVGIHRYFCSQELVLPDFLSDPVSLLANLELIK